jgi:hypothetical protein
MDPRIPDPTNHERVPLAGVLFTCVIALSCWLVAFALIRLWLL